MIVVELTIPGSRISTKESWGNDADSLSSTLQTNLDDAAMSLNLFEFQRAQPFPQPAAEDWESDCEQLQEISTRIEGDARSNNAHIDYSEIRELAEIELKRKKWSEGKLPDNYLSRLIFLHAKSYLFAIDMIGKCIRIMDSFHQRPDGVGNALSTFDTAFPSLRHVRNSVAHSEDRSRGLGRNGNAINFQPLSHPYIQAGNASVNMQQCLFDNKFGCTMADGHYGEVQVSVDSLVTACDCIQTALDAFEWDGFRSHRPR